MARAASPFAQKKALSRGGVTGEMCFRSRRAERPNKTSHSIEFRGRKRKSWHSGRWYAIVDYRPDLFDGSGSQTPTANQIWSALRPASIGAVTHTTSRGKQSTAILSRGG